MLNLLELNLFCWFRFLCLVSTFVLLILKSIYQHWTLMKAWAISHGIWENSITWIFRALYQEDFLDVCSKFHHLCQLLGWTHQETYVVLNFPVCILQPNVPRDLHQMDQILHQRAIQAILETPIQAKIQ